MGQGGELLGRMGVIADVQYAEVEDAVVHGNYPGGRQARRYSNSLQVLLHLHCLLHLQREEDGFFASILNL